MKIDSFHVGMKVRHPHHGLGIVKTITEQTVEIRFVLDGTRTIAPENSGLGTGPKHGLRSPGSRAPARATHRSARPGPSSPSWAWSARISTSIKWQADGKVAVCDVSRRRVPAEQGTAAGRFLPQNRYGPQQYSGSLEQKLNSHPNLADAEKVVMQQYITRFVRIADHVQHPVEEQKRPSSGAWSEFAWCTHFRASWWAKQTWSSANGSDPG